MSGNPSKGRKDWILRIMATAAVVAWMVVIFLMSADEGNDSGRKSDKVVKVVFDAAVKVGILEKEDVTPELREKAGFVVRKGAHMAEYAILAVLLMLALTSWGVTRIAVRAGIAVPIAALYAASDEYHQLSVSGRSGQWRDVGIDLCGVIIGAGLTAFIMFLVRRKRAKTRNASENVTKPTAE